MQARTCPIRKIRMQAEHGRHCRNADILEHELDRESFIIEHEALLATISPRPFVCATVESQCRIGRSRRCDGPRPIPGLAVDGMRIGPPVALQPHYAAAELKTALGDPV